MTRRKKRGHIGSSFDRFLKDAGTYERASAIAIKRVLAWELEQAMAKEGVSKNEMARRMRTSRSQLDRVLDPSNDRIQRDTVFNAVRVLGRDVRHWSLCSALPGNPRTPVEWSRIWRVRATR